MKKDGQKLAEMRRLYKANLARMAAHKTETSGLNASYKQIQGVNLWLSLGNGQGRANSRALEIDGQLGYLFIGRIRFDDGSTRECIQFSALGNGRLILTDLDHGREEY